MKWVTWDQAAIAAMLSSLLVVFLRRRPSTKITRLVISAARELAFISVVYSIWRVARMLPLAQDEQAIEYARKLSRLQTTLGLPSELSVQQFVIRHDWLARFSAFYYRTFHVPALLVFLIWLFFRQREHYARWRTGLTLLTAFCLVIRFIRVAPPRFLPEYGFVDLSTRYGMSSYGPVGTGVSDQFAAMPSIHIAWAAVVSLGVFVATTSRWRWAILLHLPITFFVVAATGHHWWMDGIVAMVLLGIGLRIDTVARRRWPRSESSIGALAGILGGQEIAPAAIPVGADKEPVTIAGR